MNRNEFFQALPVTRIALRLIGATLEICTDDIDDIHVMIAGDNHAAGTLRVAVSGDQLTVEQPAASLAKAPANSTWLQVTLRLPKTWKGSIEARTVSGWITARSLAGADLSLETVSGMISASDLTFITVSAKSVIGDTKVTHLNCEKCSLASTSGSVSALNASLRTATANTVTGTVTFTLAAPFEDVTMNSVSGDLCLDAPVDACDALLRSVSGRVRTSGVSIMEGAPRVRATTVSSDLDITRNDP